MPVKSEAQRRLMEGVAHGMKPTVAGKGLTKNVAKEFLAATPKGKKLPKKVSKPGKK